MEIRLIDAEALKRKDEANAFIQIINAQGIVVVPINTFNGNISYKTKCYNDGSLVRQICTEGSRGSYPYD